MRILTIALKTVQVSQWRKVKEPDRYYDITIKSGVRAFAPTWKMLMAHKAKEMDDETYRFLYIKLMLERILHNPEFYRKLILEVLESSVTTTVPPAIVMACYCKAHGFCHRYILIHDVFPQVKEDLGIEFEYLGEVT